jgi:hypothetical protein
MTRHDRLSLEQNESFQLWEWRCIHIGWALWGLVIAAALAGLLGNGPLSSTIIASPDDSIRVRYHRFVHVQQPLNKEITIRNETTAGEVMVKLFDKFLHQIEIHRIQPEPSRTEIAEDGVIFMFQRDRAAAETKVKFRFEYEDAGNGLF